MGVSVGDAARALGEDEVPGNGWITLNFLLIVLTYPPGIPGTTWAGSDRFQPVLALIPQRVFSR